MGAATSRPAHRGVAEHYRRHIRDTGREARFLIALAFLLTFGVVRFITYSIRYHWLPFLHDNVTRAACMSTTSSTASSFCSSSATSPSPSRRTRGTD